MNNRFNIKFVDVRIRYMILNDENYSPLIIEQPITIAYDYAIQNVDRLKNVADELSIIILKSILEKVGDKKWTK